MRQYSKLTYISIIFSIIGFYSIFVASMIVARADQVMYPNFVGNIKPVVLNIDENGNVLMRGIVKSISPNTLTIDSWGGTWTIITNSTSEGTLIEPTSSIIEGDLIGVIGHLNNGSPWSIDASYIRNWTNTESQIGNQNTENTPNNSSPIYNPPISTTNISPNFFGRVQSVEPNDTESGALKIIDSYNNTYTVIVEKGSLIENSRNNPIMLMDVLPQDSVGIEGILIDSSTINPKAIINFSR